MDFPRISFVKFAFKSIRYVFSMCTIDIFLYQHLTSYLNIFTEKKSIFHAQSQCHTLKSIKITFSILLIRK